MSGDIVERLRLLAKMYPQWGEVKNRSNEAAYEVERLRAEVERLRAENAEQAQGWRAERALADQLADALGNEWPGISNKPYSDVSTAHAATTAALSAWQEARRER